MLAGGRTLVNRRMMGGVPSDSQPLVRVITPGDRQWVAATLVREWASTSVARRGELVEAAGLSGYLATVDRRRVGLVLVNVSEEEFEVVALSTTQPRSGIGRALMERCFAEAQATACRRVWLVTTNNNIAAIAFYQHVGMDLQALHRNAVRGSRKLKPTIPMRDAEGVRIDHELEFELLLQS